MNTTTDSLRGKIVYQSALRRRLPLPLILALSVSSLVCTEKTQDLEETDREDTLTTAAVLPTDSAVAPAGDPGAFIIEAPLDSPGELEQKRRRIYDWFPQHAGRLDYVLDGVTKIYMFRDLGLDDQAEVVMPRVRQPGWPVGHSVRLKLPGEKTALAMRFELDSLPGERAQGEGILGLFAVHCSDVFGRDVELPRVHGNTGRFELLFLGNHLMAQLACCELPPTFSLGTYGAIKDTLALVVVFDTTRSKYIILLLGPRGGRAYPGYNYSRFRTERGEYHRDQEEYPYFCRGSELDYVNLFIGNCWRGRKSVREPVLRVRIF